MMEKPKEHVVNKLNVIATDFMKTGQTVIAAGLVGVLLLNDKVEFFNGLFVVSIGVIIY